MSLFCKIFALEIIIAGVKSANVRHTHYDMYILLLLAVLFLDRLIMNLLLPSFLVSWCYRFNCQFCKGQMHQQQITRIEYFDIK